MSCLKLYWPQALSLYSPALDEWSDESSGPEEPVVLSFPRKGKPGGGSQRELLSRARLIHANRECPDCRRAAVVPVDAEPALMSRNNMPVPGSSRLVGFACDCCGHAWNV
jgi:hypothetical protein